MSVLWKWRKRLQIGRAIFKKIDMLVSVAKEKYNITYVNGTTYDGDNEMPFSWYKRIGFVKVKDLFLIEGKAEDIINKIK